MRCRTARALAVKLLLFLTLPAMADVQPPEVTGPVPARDIPGSPSRNYPFFATNHPLASNGYTEEEYFVRGTANTYKTGGFGTVETLKTGQPYYTRIVVRRPANPKHFNGTVIVEWVNSTNYFDAENVWFFTWEDILRSGYAWVGVSPQTIGVDALKKWNPERYGQFTVGQIVPNDASGGKVDKSDFDAMSFDVFSQVGAFLKQPSKVNPLRGLKPKVFLATGESQAAMRLSTYVNNLHPTANVYDGFLLLSSSVPIRNDLISPVFKVMTEHDVVVSGAATRQPDTDKFREWEIAGSSHVDQHLRVSREALELRDNGRSLEAAMAPTCAIPQVGTRVPTGHVVAAAFHHLVRWVVGGKPPPVAPKLEITEINPPPRQSLLARNADNLALGGIQLPQVAVPTQINIGVGAPSRAAIDSGISGEAIGAGACVRWGASLDMTVEQLRARYPSHSEYIAKFRSIARDNVARGYLLKQDADDAIRAAEASRVGDR